MHIFGVFVMPATPDLTAMAMLKTHIKLPQGTFWPQLSMQVRLYSIKNHTLVFPDVKHDLHVGDGQFLAFELEHHLYVWPLRDNEGKPNGGLELLATSDDAVESLGRLMAASNRCIGTTPALIKQAEAMYLRGKAPDMYCSCNQWPTFQAIQHGLQLRAGSNSTACVVLNAHDLPLSEFGL